MSRDISQILKDWEFIPDEVTVRWVRGDDGKDKVQLRVDLGLLQMEVDGRPDGARPEGQESWLDYYEGRARQQELAQPDGPRFTLGEEECTRLWREAVQYYHRYLSFWHLERFDLCVRDTGRNLRAFAFVKAHAENERFKLQFDQWRPYVTMMNTRAQATPLVRDGKLAQALELIEVGIGAIRDFLDEYGQSKRAAECVELVNLEQWHEEVLREQRQKPPDTQDKADLAAHLRRQLNEAVAREDFEEAARLRDEIRRLAE
jgi:hypothetical protein